MTEKISNRVYEDIDAVYENFEKWINSFIENIDVDLMPGAQDFSNAYMPQQPLNSFLFPNLSDKE